MFFREVGGEREQFSPNEQLYKYLEGGNRSLTEPMVHDRVFRSDKWSHESGSNLEKQPPGFMLL